MNPVTESVTPATAARIAAAIGALFEPASSNDAPPGHSAARRTPFRWEVIAGGLTQRKTQLAESGYAVQPPTREHRTTGVRELTAEREQDGLDPGTGRKQRRRVH